MAEREEKKRAMELAIAQIEKQFGKGSIMKLGATEAPPDVPVIPSGSLGLDLALGVGGLPRGRVIEIFGPESSGKTTLMLHTIAEAQKAGGTAAFIDAEHALDLTYAEKLGVNTADLLVSQPDTGEQALEITETLVRSGAVDIIVIDSVAALVPPAELEGEMGGAHMLLQARLMSPAVGKLTASSGLARAGKRRGTISRPIRPSHARSRPRSARPPAWAPRPKGTPGRLPRSVPMTSARRPARVFPKADPIAEAVRYLARGDRSAAQVQHHLAGRGLPGTEIRRALRTLQRLGYVDDEAVARRMAEARLARRPMAREALAAELEARGFSAGAVARAVQHAYAGLSEEAVAER